MIKELNIEVGGGGGWGLSLGETSPQGVMETKETWGDKGREGTPKNRKMGRRLLWMVPKVKTHLSPSANLCKMHIKDVNEETNDKTFGLSTHSFSSVVLFLFTIS